MIEQPATSIDAVPAEELERGFRLLILRQFQIDDEPPAFALIEQHVLRSPQRLSRHGLSFSATFLPEIMAWLIEFLGRPTLHDADGKPCRNALWPALTWQCEDRSWQDGSCTVEWFIHVVFPEEAAWAAFQRHWHQRLLGELELQGQEPSQS
ncbi:MAG TPA: hypothetical protein VME69_08050 [Methylocella sp.]|nr:hypothetical protein [Methylocella sp.]